MSYLRVQKFVRKSEAEGFGRCYRICFDISRRRVVEMLNYCDWENSGISMMS